MTDTKTVLIVDDEPDIAMIMRLALEHAGFRVVAAEDGQGALDILDGELPDLVLLDIMLPGLNGWEILEQLRVRGSLERLRVIVCSAHADIVLPKRAADYGCGFLPKPFAPKDLVEAVRAALAS